MSRAIFVVTRIGLCFLGLVFVGGGVARLVIGDVLHSETPPVPGGVLLALDIGSIGYGLLLMAPPGWISRKPWLVVVLSSLTIAFGVGVLSTSLERGSAIYAVLSVAFRAAIPAVVAFGMIAWEYRRNAWLSKQRTPTDTGRSTR